jgi:putative ABC transport system permease protein
VVTHPFAGNGGVDAIWYGEAQSAETAGNPYSNYEGVDAAYFQTMGLAILRGRGTLATDRASSPRVAVVNQAFARLYWPGRDPVGRRIKPGAAESQSEWHTVVGVAADARYRELTTIRPTVYIPYEQGIPVRPNYIALRTAAPVAALATALRQIVREQEPGAAVLSLSSLPQLLAQPLARPRFQSALLLAFAMMGLALSVVGTYGTLAFFVRQRRREIGIRMALGAAPSRVRALVLRQALIMAAAGIAIGMGASAATAPLLQSLLFEVSPLDPLVFAGTAAALLSACITAAIVPTRLAAQTDPLVVIRSD